MQRRSIGNFRKFCEIPSPIPPAAQECLRYAVRFGERDEMILYHFTAFYNLDHPEDGRTILKEGLKPNGKKGMPPLDAVWFTTQADPEFMFAKEDGTLDADWKKHNARIKVVIPSTDKRLMKWETWLREQSFVSFNDRIFLPSEMINAIYAHNLMGYKFYYVYFGSIPPSEFRVVEYEWPFTYFKTGALNHSGAAEEGC
jgi:hypothetical protein